MKHIRDYLQTQALVIDADEVAIARTATQAVLANAQAHIDHQVLQYEQQPESLFSQIDILKQLYMALDATYSRYPVKTAVIYGCQPKEHQLVQLVQVGDAIETRLSADDDSAWQYLAVRSAHSGWVNIAENVDKWLLIGELHGEHNRRTYSQTSLPIYGDDGMVYGVLHIESDMPLSDSAMAHWLGLALGVLPVLRELLPRSVDEDV